MRKESKIPVYVALSLMLLGFALFPQLNRSTTAAENAQSVTDYSLDQTVIARVTVKNLQELDSLRASGVTLLEGRIKEDVFVLTTLGKLEELRQQAWPVTLLYIRSLGFKDTWTSVVEPSGECTYTIAPTHKSFTDSGGVHSFDLTTGDTCEWVIISDSSWLHVAGLSQGTGSTTFSFLVDANSGPTNRIGHLFVEGQVFTVFQGVRFNDVPTTHPFYAQIGFLSARGITAGCGGGNYCPDQAVTREQMSAFIIRSIGEFNPPVPAMQRFDDVPPTSPFYAFIEEMAVRQITAGCGVNIYCPTDAVLREQMAAFIIRGIGEFDPPEPPTQRFLDVPPTNPFYRFIDRMAALGITAGCGNNLFCPKSPTSRGQAAVFLVRAFDL